MNNIVRVQGGKSRLEFMYVYNILIHNHCNAKLNIKKLANI